MVASAEASTSAGMSMASLNWISSPPPSKVMMKVVPPKVPPLTWSTTSERMTSQRYTCEATTMSSPSAVWLAWVPNHSTSFSWATPVAPTTIWAEPVSTSAPAEICD